ncbi:ComF family protein [Salinisphaera sp. SPP-AMP-43]|uniref:double zinc ribbon domain-containing protein n=1 Tax=Salinisphaera sp. SPP-AMP-43 TaxID=3121288 RepID=UPI003C6EA08F
MSKFLYNWIKTAQNAVLAPCCPICAATIDAEAGLCAGCAGELPWLEIQCQHCALPLTAEAKTRVCADCARRPRFDRALAACRYRDPVAWLIGGLKYRHQLAYARVLGDLLATRLSAEAMPDLLAPVPLHPAGFRRRGFNQAERIAAHVHRRLGWPLDSDTFTRIRDTARQSTLNADARAANMRGAFIAQRALHGRRVALIDDVMTTTRTAAALARSARQAGAREVVVYCVARA